MAGDNPRTPKLLVVPEPRDRDQRYAAFSDAYQPPRAFPEPEDTPWTHGGQPPPYVPAEEDAWEAWS